MWADSIFKSARRKPEIKSMLTFTCTTDKNSK